MMTNFNTDGNPRNELASKISFLATDTSIKNKNLAETALQNNLVSINLKKDYLLRIQTFYDHAKVTVTTQV